MLFRTGQINGLLVQSKLRTAEKPDSNEIGQVPGRSLHKRGWETAPWLAPAARLRFRCRCLLRQRAPQGSLWSRTALLFLFSRRKSQQSEICKAKQYTRKILWEKKNSLISQNSSNLCVMTVFFAQNWFWYSTFVHRGSALYTKLLTSR